MRSIGRVTDQQSDTIMEWQGMINIETDWWRSISNDTYKNTWSDARKYIKWGPQIKGATYKYSKGYGPT